MSKEEESSITDNIFTQAIYNTVHEPRGILKSIASELGMANNVLTDKCNPNNNKLLEVVELYKIIEFTNKSKSKPDLSLSALSREFNHVCVKNNINANISDDEIIRSRSNWEIERAKTCELIDNIREDKKVTRNEIIQLKEEIYDDFSIQLALLSKLKSCVNGTSRKRNKTTLTDVFTAVGEAVNKIKDISLVEKKLGIKKAGYLKNACNPKTKEQLNAIHMRGIISFTEDFGILKTFCNSLNHTCINLNAYKDTDIDDSFKKIRFKWDKERGQTDMTISNALSDESITTKDYHDIEKEIYDDFKIEIAVLNSIHKN